MKRINGAARHTRGLQLQVPLMSCRGIERRDVAGRVGKPRALHHGRDREKQLLRVPRRGDHLRTLESPNSAARYFFVYSSAISGRIRSYHAYTSPMFLLSDANPQRFLRSRNAIDLITQCTRSERGKERGRKRSFVVIGRYRLPYVDHSRLVNARYSKIGTSSEYSVEIKFSIIRPHFLVIYMHDHDAIIPDPIENPLRKYSALYV